MASTLEDLDPAARQTRREPPPSVMPRSVLCVNATADGQDFVRKALSQHNVVVTGMAFEALRALNKSAFDLYVLDLWLTDWNGASLCRDVRKLDPHVPVCFYASVAASKHRQRALNAGASLYIEAPVPAAVFSRRIAALLETADIANRHAKVEAELAIRAELAARAAAAPASGDAMKRAAAAIERSTKIKAYRVFVEAGGARAEFERWWPGEFASAWADANAEMAPTRA